MPPTFDASIKQVQEFAARASYDDEFRKELETNPHEAMALYGVHIPVDEIPEVRTLPSKAQCAALLALILEYDCYAAGEYDPITLAFFILVYGFAMPLVPTAEGEVGAAR